MPDLATVSYLGSIASIVGLVVAILGFVYTIYVALGSRKAAEAAKAASESVAKNIARIDALTILTSAIALMENIKGLCVTKTLQSLPDRCSEARRWIVRFSEAAPDLEWAHKSRLTATAQTLSDLESLITETTDPDTFNFIEISRKLSRHIDDLNRLHVQIKRKMGAQYEQG
jgi:hypothetical protein